MGFCVPVAFPSGVTPDGGIIIQTGHVCYGDAVPAPDLPPVDMPVPGADLPEPVIPETAPDLVGGQDLTTTETGTDVEARAEEDVDDDVCTEGCENCRAASMGTFEWRNYAPDNAPFHEEHTWQGYRYQAHVCGTAHDPVGGRIMEHNFLAPPHWDGFELATCRMLEAKWGYDGLLEQIYVEVNGDARMRTVPLPGRGNQARARFARLVAQATAQKGRLSSYPEVGLLWMFESWDSFFFFGTVGGKALGIDVERRAGPGV